MATSLCKAPVAKAAASGNCLLSAITVLDGWPGSATCGRPKRARKFRHGRSSNGRFLASNL
jgi:hypothetical protein